MSEMLGNRLGAVAIGRNEGERLERCLRSLVSQLEAVVYVDSGSSDGSVATARSLGVEVVELDMSVPFTMARGRNAGITRLLERHPHVELVQFVDGDCEVVDGWLERGAAAMDANPEAAVVSGRRRERHRDASIYNTLCDLEWDTPIGRVKSCHGDAMVRVRALRGAGGFNESLICGEEPELCVRLRGSGWDILRIDADMTRHDAAMTRFGQWWRRSVRGGWAYAEGAAMHGASGERHNVRQSRSVWWWGLILPVLAVALAWPTRGLSLVLLLGYPVLAWRVSRYQRRRGASERDARLYGAFCTLAKFPQMTGQMRYWWNRARGKRAQLIEYKGPSAPQNELAKQHA